MTTRELITLLLECKMDAEISFDDHTCGPISEGAEIVIRKIESSDHGFGQYAIIRIGEKQS